ncbi:MAG: hypothetical protein COV41_00670 [Candidatus Brennerbacteria bacterium CG11_big_fil_rev_8_21_14_0_20_43_10]|uniref:Uncharacterized protein n=2 Tax=Candidatus Brenneribacteriota TaxID=1817902 RepID=A0A2M8C1C5_9BACT|nr:MAG: hypothetical protein AUJ43_00440 [Parcubacteria group bacterium CG1_02_44_31]PIP50352.1 MAG: hypothetical protein COX12_01765 [Candidatus Brennerbacteria bacterium CG23_combo_of_CG06-09_8_20_14_all_44_41]PIR26820.1 MAG: hypothetical protein COV41_00670 [Candidatus Brennerbacteria bacterium CG11_big_fil_rev_8_21_14_0_20_43_10]PJA19168.1 MAG: hypothetical protein COX61_01880 [Candidatus Brennerbacteria bacterium CG_4_10_14_0_2_um_filter_43_14]PJB49864.1 MAG: hypothetical protein CO102_026
MIPDDLLVLNIQQKQEVYVRLRSITLDIMKVCAESFWKWNLGVAYKFGEKIQQAFRDSGSALDYRSYVAWHVLMGSNPSYSEITALDFSGENSVEAFLLRELDALQRDPEYLERIEKTQRGVDFT